MDKKMVFGAFSLYLVVNLANHTRYGIFDPYACFPLK